MATAIAIADSRSGLTTSVLLAVTWLLYSSGLNHASEKFKQPELKF
jgi:hypothetical protein